MIIWINGTYGVGKTSVAKALKEITKNSFELIHSDIEYQKMIRKNEYLAFGGALPQNNDNFIKYLREKIQNRINKNKNIIVDMAITDKKSKNGIIDYFKNKDIVILHFICTANEKELKSRILTDNKRDKTNSLYYININKKFLEKNFKNDIWVDTNNKNVEEIANEIYKELKEKINN